MTRIPPLVSVAEKARKALAAKDRLELGRLIVREIDHRDAGTADLVKLTRRIGCSVRTARYVADVYRLAQKVGLSRREVTEIGWTKLAVVAAATGGKATKSELLAYCAGRTVTEVRAALAGVGGAVKTVVFTLNKGQRADLDAALVRFGARRSGRSIQDKEQALMKIISKVA